MLRITVQADAAAAKTYFRQATHDYLAEGEPSRPGSWSGRGAAMLGLTGEIAKEEWDRLCDNLHPQTGRQLTAAMRHPRRIYYDCTWSMPKGCSLASLFDDRVIPAFLRAVEYGNGLIEDDLRARVRIGGADEDRVTGNAVVGTYLHTDGRPVDGVPDRQVHAHSCFFNATRDGTEGRWKAAQLGYVKTHAGFYEAATLAHFARDLVDLGYGVRRKGKFFELEHVPDAVTDKFSNRTRLIERTAAELGITDPAAKARLGAQTRERKQARLTGVQLESLWVSRLTEAEVALLKCRPGQQTPLPAAGDSARFAVDHGFHHEAVASEKSILEHGLRHGFGAIDLPTLRAELNRAGLVTREGRATTAEMLGLEAGLLRWAAGGRGAVKPIGWTANAAALAPLEAPRTAAPTLNAGQRAAVAHVLTGRDRVTLVEGKAGTGKTTALEVVAAGVRQAGLPIRALANTHEAVKTLGRVDPHARTLASFLASRPAQQAVAGGVVVLDEASQVGHRDMNRLFAALDRVGARAVLVGDRHQHAAVAAGAPYRLLIERAGLPVAAVDEIVRQQVPLYKEACRRFARHDTRAGLDVLERMGAVRELPEPYRSEALVLDYLGETAAGREVLVVAPTHREADHVTARLRAGLRAAGRLTGEDRPVDRLVNLNWTDAQRAELARAGSAEARAVAAEGLVVTRWGVYRPATLAVAVGDELRATGGFADAAGGRVRTGSRFTVTGFTAAGIAVDTLGGGRRVLPPDARHLAHAYCQTSYSSQSRTVDAVLVAESTASHPAADRAQMYVTASRGRHRIGVYTDSIEGLREAADRDRKKENATDLVAGRAAPSEPANRVRDRARFVRRLWGVAAEVAGRVRAAVRAPAGREREREHDRTR